MAISMLQVHNDPSMQPFLGGRIEKLAASVPVVRRLKLRVALSYTFLTLTLLGPHAVGLAIKGSVLNIVPPGLMIVGATVGLIASNHFWRSVQSIASNIDELFVAGSVPPLTTVVASFQRLLKPIWGLVISLVPGATLAIIRATHAEANESSWTLWFGVLYSFVLGFIGGYGSYMIILASLLAFRLGRAQGLALDWPHPLATPGLLGVSHILRRSAQIGLAILVLGSTALLVQYFLTRSAFDAAFMAVGVLTGLTGVVGVGIASQIWLANAASGSDATSQRLAAAVQEARRACVISNFVEAVHVERLARLMQIDATVNASLRSYNDKGILAAYAATAVGVILQLLFAALVPQ